MGTDIPAGQHAEREAAGPRGTRRGETEIEEGQLARSPLAMSCRCKWGPAAFSSSSGRPLLSLELIALLSVLPRTVGFFSCLTTRESRQIHSITKNPLLSLLHVTFTNSPNGERHPHLAVGYHSNPFLPVWCSEERKESVLNLPFACLPSLTHPSPSQASCLLSGGLPPGHVWTMLLSLPGTFPHCHSFCEVSSPYSLNPAHSPGPA